MRVKRKRVDVNLEELDRVLDAAREAPLSEPEYEKLKDASARAGGHAAATTHYREDQERFGTAGSARA